VAASGIGAVTYFYLAILCGIGLTVHFVETVHWALLLSALTVRFQSGLVACFWWWCVCV
jgi:hypothetical protein